MAIKKLWDIDQLANAYVAEDDAGNLWTVLNAPLPRDISKDTLMPYAGPHPRKIGGTLLPDYLLRQFSLRNIVAYHRERLSLTQTQLAHKSGLHRQKIARIEGGDIDMANITLANAVALAQALEISVEKLL